MPSSKKILVVDGDALWRERITTSLASPLLAIESVATGSEALEHAKLEKPDLIATELVLPDMTGFGLCRLAREEPALVHAGIVMVTGHASEIDRILAFENGVDDLLAKPFYPRELSSRVGAVLRRSSGVRRGVGDVEETLGGGPTVHIAGGSILVGDQRLELTPREHHLLVALIRQAGRVVTRRQLIDAVWGGDAAHTDRIIDAHVKSIRRKLGEAKDCVETVRGVGYRFSELGGR